MDTQSMVPLLDSVGIWVSVILTLFVFSYLLGDNILYRIAEHLFVGVTIGYVMIVVFHRILAPKLLIPIADAIATKDYALLVPLLISALMGLFLLARPVKLWPWLGNLSVAVLLGVGGALAITGALLGTLLPQIDATADITRMVDRYGPGLGFASGIVVLVGVAGVLLHFYSGSGGKGPLFQVRDRLVKAWGGLGRWFIVIAFGAILATTFMSRLSLLIDRVQFLLDVVRGLFGG